MGGLLCIFKAISLPINQANIFINKEINSSIWLALRGGHGQEENMIEFLHTNMLKFSKMFYLEISQQNIIRLMFQLNANRDLSKR